MLNRLWIFFVTICVFIVGIPLLLVLTMVPFLLIVDFVGQLIGSYDVASWIILGLIFSGFAWIVSGTYLETERIREDTIRIKAETEALKKTREQYRKAKEVKEDVC